MSRFDRLRDVCEVCFVEAPDREAAAALALAALILTVFGLILIVAAYQDSDRRACPRWHWRRWAPPTFAFWLGAMMLYDAAIYTVLTLSVLARPDGVDLWALLLLCGLAVVSVTAFLFWGRDRRRGRRRRGVS